MTDYKLLIDSALEARKRAYAPYSNFEVGAALLTKNGKIYTGCNIENSSYGATVCAERVAFGSAVADGNCSFCAIAIVGGVGKDVGAYTYPCGICLQVMGELCNHDFEIVLYDGKEPRIHKLSELLPRGFKL